MDEQLRLFDEPQYNTIVGADEAGRGPLAGPVSAAAVVLPKNFPFEILNDSKKMSEKQRLFAEQVIKKEAIAWAVSFCTHKEIDEINILNASLLAMKKAYEKVCIQLKEKGIVAEILYVDGNKRPEVNIPCVAVVKGDAKIYEIMAASILAKTARDRFMLAADKKWPMYDFKTHKGYPTAKHKQALREYGYCPIHRRTFKF